MIYSNPSFETEKHTHAFGAMLWWAVSLISMFTVGTGVTAIGLCGASVLKITSTFLQDNTVIVLMMFFAVAIVIFFIGLLRFASVLTTSYKFDGNTIIKGTLAVRGGLISKITANTDFEFVRANFDTDRYKKTIYENAVLTGETKRYLKYSSNGRTIKILKIYDSMPDLRIAENTVKKSVASRVRSAATERSTEFGVTFFDCRITCHVAGFFFFIHNCGYVLKRLSVIVTFRIYRIGKCPTVNENEFHFWAFFCNRSHCSCLQETGSDDNFCAVLDCLTHCSDTIVVGCVCAVCGLIVLIGEAVCFGICLCAFVSSLVETTVHQLTDVCNDCNLIRFRSVVARCKACHACDNKSHTKYECYKFFHKLSPFWIF